MNSGDGWSPVFVPLTVADAVIFKVELAFAQSNVIALPAVSGVELVGVTVTSNAALVSRNANPVKPVAVPLVAASIGSAPTNVVLVEIILCPC